MSQAHPAVDVASERRSAPARWSGLVATVLAIFAVVFVSVASRAPAAAASAWPACVARSAPVHVGARELARSREGRLITLRLRSQAMGNVQPVRVLLPAGYGRSSGRRYVVLYLLHGAGGDYRTWSDVDHIQALLGDLPVITVMPGGTQDGADGGYTDWFGLPPGAPGQAPAWESFHIRELVPFIDRHFRTIAAAGGRAIAGISMGGGGAVKYAAEYPGTFGYAGTFSGEANPLLPLAVAFQTKSCKWGDPATQEVVWRDNDATNLARNLRGVRLFVRSGTGAPGPYDPPVPEKGTPAYAIYKARLAIEYGAHQESAALVAAARKEGVRSVDARFFPGSHSRPYWQRDTRELVAWLRGQLRDPPRAPSTIRVLSAHRRFTAWGWAFTAHRRIREFAYLRIDGSRLRVTGSGLLDVVTPSRYRPGGRYRVRIGARVRAARGDSHGRLRFTVSLGPSHTVQQRDFGVSATQTWRTATATVLSG